MSLTQDQLHTTAADQERGLYPLCRNCDRAYVEALNPDNGQLVPRSSAIPAGIAATHDGLSDVTAGPEPIEIAAAGRLRLTLQPTNSTWLAGIEQEGLLPETEVRSVAWAPSPPVGDTPAGGVRAAAIPEAELTTGAVQLARTDLTLPAPGLDVAVSRAYTSGGISWGELGWGWSLDVGGRLRPLPNGEVELRTATGKRYTFSHAGPGASSDRLTAVGVPFKVGETRDGAFIVHRPDGGYTEYSADGYPQRAHDRLRTNDNAGSEIDYLWSASGRLLMIDQRNGKHTTTSHPRRIAFAYFPEGLLESATDSAGRRYEYAYDGSGRLTKAKIRNVQLDADGGAGDVFESYAWAVAPPVPDTAQSLVTGGLLASVKDGASPERTIFAAEYDAATHKAAKISYGEIEHTIAYPSERVAKVTGVAVELQVPAQVEELHWDDLGRITQSTVGTNSKATTAYSYAPGNWDPLPVAIDLPTAGANEITQQWWWQAHPSASRLMSFNLASRTPKAPPTRRPRPRRRATSTRPTPTWSPR